LTAVIGIHVGQHLVAAFVVDAQLEKTSVRADFEDGAGGSNQPALELPIPLG